MLLPALLALACRPTEPVDEAVPWTKVRTPLAEDIGPIGEYVPLRTIVHLHSPYSHDACDGDGWVDGVLDEACLQSLRDALCDDAIDVAFLTDHPDYADRPSYEDLLLAREGDTEARVGGAVVGNTIACAGGHSVTWLPGFEDALMPVALDAHVDDDPGERHDLLNGDGQASVDAAVAAGGVVLLAHTEGKDEAYVERLQEHGLAGLEVFNLHAMFAPDKREQDLGLDPFSWLEDASPFFDPDGAAEPDLLFLAVLQEQAPSVARWDAALQRGPMLGVGGSDAHENAIPALLRDDERGDSYRRVLSWFSNVVLAEGRAPDQIEAALAAGRSYVVFEALGVADDFDFRLLADDGRAWPMGSEAPAGTLFVACPTLSDASPRGLDDPDVTVTIYRNGEPWQTGCGFFPADGPAVYRARVDITPRHLAPFLGAAPDPWMRPFPWIYGNAIRVGY